MFMIEGPELIPENRMLRDRDTTGDSGGANATDNWETNPRPPINHDAIDRQFLSAVRSADALSAQELNDLQFSQHVDGYVSDFEHWPSNQITVDKIAAAILQKWDEEGIPDERQLRVAKTYAVEVADILQSREESGPVVEQERQSDRPEEEPEAEQEQAEREPSGDEKEWLEFFRVTRIRLRAMLGEIDGAEGEDLENLEQELKAIRDDLQQRDLELEELSDQELKVKTEGGLGKLVKQVETIAKELAQKRSGIEKKGEGATYIEKVLDGMKLKEVIHEMETTGALGEEETRFAYERIVLKKAREMADQIENEEMREAFYDLCFQIIVLIEFGVVTPASIDAQHVTVADRDKLLDCLKKTSGDRGALKFNSDFNENLLVGAGKRGEKEPGKTTILPAQVDQEQYGPNMGIIQKIVCVAYDFMKEAYEKDKNGKYKLNKKGEKIKTTYGRTDDYKEGMSQELVEMVCGLESHTITSVDDGEQEIRIKEDIEQFPEEVRELLKYFAVLKMSRDDLGNKASNYVMAFSEKSPKLGGTGSGAMDAGYISKSIYKAAQSANNKEHMILWAYTDPFGMGALQTTETSERTDLTPEAKAEWRKMKKEGAVSRSWSRVTGADGVNDAILMPDEDDYRAKRLWRKISEMNNYYSAFRPDWTEEVLLKDGMLQAKPERWDDDFPDMSDMTNRMDGKSAADYQMAISAFRSIIESAYKSPSWKFSRKYDLLRVEIEEILSPLFTEIARLFAYLGGGYPGDRLYKFHEIPKAAVKFALANLMIKAVGQMISPAENVLEVMSTFGADNFNKEVERLIADVISIIEEQVRDYPSISSYKDELIAFVQSEALLPIFIDPIKRRNMFNTGRIVLDSRLITLKGNQMDDEYKNTITMPFSPFKDDSKDH
jgi:hypothetical protein